MPNKKQLRAERRQAMSERKALLTRRMPKYRKDIALFAREMFDFEPDDWQKQFFRDVVESNRVSVKSGQGVGKTGCEAILLLWFLSCFPNAKVVATAPTRRQLQDVLWAEVDKWLSRSPVLSQTLKWTKTYIYMVGHEKRWFATARTANKAENMQGFHELNMLFLVDEASGILEPIMEAILGTLSGPNNKLVMCGNPTKTSGTFYDSHTRDRAIYRCITVNSEDSPRTNKENIAALARKYGKDSNVYRVRVKGEFPLQEDDVFISLALIEQAVMTEPDQTGRISMGVDVARFGDDETIILTKVGNRVEMPVIRHGQDLMRTVGDIVITYRRLLEEHPLYTGSIACIIDDTGLGGGVTDRLREVKAEQNLFRLQIVPVNAGQAVPKVGAQNYANITTFMWGTVRDLLEERQISLVNDNELVAQLSVRKYSINSSGKLALESKDDMKKRDIDSPDRADALALACFTPPRVFESFMNSIMQILLDAADMKNRRYERITLGISISRAFNKTAFVATGVTFGYREVIGLSSTVVDGSTDTAELGRQFAKFALKVQKDHGAAMYAYCDPNETVLLRSIKQSFRNLGINTAVRSSSGEELANRILMVNRMISTKRLFIGPDAGWLAEALSEAQWSDKGKPDSRPDTMYTAVLNAFEYTVERDAVKFIRNEV